MRSIILAIAVAATVTGCGEVDPALESAERQRLSRSIAEVMCVDDAEERALAMSRVVEQTNGDSDAPEQAVYEEASGYTDGKCPDWAK